MSLDAKIDRTGKRKKANTNKSVGRISARLHPHVYYSFEVMLLIQDLLRSCRSAECLKDSD